MADDLKTEISYLRLSADGLRAAPEGMDTDRVAATFGRAADALDAALRLAEQWEADAAELDRDIAGARTSPYASDHTQALADEALAGKLRECAADLREAITRALAGEDDGGR